MSWFFWMLSYLFVGSLLVGWIASCAVKKGTFDPKNPKGTDIGAYMLCVALWPIVMCLLIVMGIAHAVDKERKAS